MTRNGCDRKIVVGQVLMKIYIFVVSCVTDIHFQFPCSKQLTSSQS